MLSNFWCLSVFTHEPFFFCLKIPLMVTFIVAHVHLVKKSVENSNTCEVFNEDFNVLIGVCLSVTFYNGTKVNV